MYIVPIATRARGSDIQQVWLLLERNGLIFLPVDCDKTDMSSFYSWREVLPGTVPSKEVWRQFVWASDSLDVNLLLNSILIGDPEHSVYSVLNAYLKANR